MSNIDKLDKNTNFVRILHILKVGRKLKYRRIYSSVKIYHTGFSNQFEKLVFGRIHKIFTSSHWKTQTSIPYFPPKTFQAPTPLHPGQFPTYISPVAHFPFGTIPPIPPV